MSAPRLLLVALLISIFGLPVAAQSLSETSALQLLPAPPQDSPTGIRVDQFQLSPGRDEVKPWHIIPAPEFRAPILASDATCYSLRTYLVTRDDPESDHTRFGGYSTCQPATGFRVKDVGNSPAQKSAR